MGSWCRLSPNEAAMSLGEVSLSGGPATVDSGGPAFLMCPPSLYDVNYVINPWMEGNVNRSSRQLAERQREALYAALARLARGELGEPQGGPPPPVFPTKT